MKHDAAIKTTELDLHVMPQNGKCLHWWKSRTMLTHNFKTQSYPYGLDVRSASNSTSNHRDGSGGFWRQDEEMRWRALTISLVFYSFYLKKKRKKTDPKQIWQNVKHLFNLSMTLFPVCLKCFIIKHFSGKKS